MKRNAFQSQSYSKLDCITAIKLQFTKLGFLPLFTQTDTILNTGLLSVGGLLPKPARRIKRYPAHFIVEGEFIRRLIQDYRPFVARSSPQKVDIKIIKTCPNPRTHGGLLPPQLRLPKIP